MEGKEKKEDPPTLESVSEYSGLRRVDVGSQEKDFRSALSPVLSRKKDSSEIHKSPSTRRVDTLRSKSPFSSKGGIKVQKSKVDVADLSFSASVLKLSSGDHSDSVGKIQTFKSKWSGSLNPCLLCIILQKSCLYSKIIVQIRRIFRFEN